MGYLVSVTFENFTRFILYKLSHEKCSSYSSFEEEQIVAILERHPEIFTRISVSLCNNQTLDFNLCGQAHLLRNILSTYPSIIDDFPEELLCCIVALHAADVSAI